MVETLVKSVTLFYIKTFLMFSQCETSLTRDEFVRNCLFFPLYYRIRCLSDIRYTILDLLVTIQFAFRMFNARILQEIWLILTLRKSLLSMITEILKHF